MSKSYAAVALFAGLALSIPIAGNARADVRSIPSADQPRVAETTLKLENAFDRQFVDGTIDRHALAGPIDDVVNAMPEEARPIVKDHIELVLRTGEKLAGQMTPEQRQAAATPPPLERIGRTQQQQLAAWGWPGGGGLGWGGLGGGFGIGGFGGFGAFGFPGMWGNAWGGLGWGGLGWGAAGWGAAGWSSTTTFTSTVTTTSLAVYPFGAYGVWGPYAGWGGGWGSLGLGGWGW